MTRTKHIILGISGSIAAYKSIELLRALQKMRMELDVIITLHATYFVTALTFETLLGKKVYTSLWDNNTSSHIKLAKADLLVIAPATANIIAKCAHGIADDLLSSTVLAFQGKKIFVPAMHESMYLNPITQNNIALLEHHGALVLKPDQGPLASGESGKGRLPHTTTILKAITRVLKQSKTH